MNLTVAICTYRRFDRLKLCLNSLQKQNVPQSDYKIIVIDNSLSPIESKTFEESLHDFINLEYIITKKCGIAYARNEALKRCETDMLAYTDDDCIVPINWVESILSVFSLYSEGIAVVGGRVKPLWEEMPPHWVAGELLGYLGLIDWGEEDIFIDDHGSGKWLVTANSVYRVKALRLAGGFPEQLGRKRNLLLSNEEYAANQNLFSLGYDILYSPSIEVFHYIPDSRISQDYFYREAYWSGVSNALHSIEGITGEDTDRLADVLLPLQENLMRNIKTVNNIEQIEKNIRDLSKQGYEQANKFLEEKNSFDPFYKNAWPVIYIVTPCLNSVDIIDRTITSVFTQAGDFSIRYHIQDFGSTDGTLEKLDCWKKRLREGIYPIQCKNIVFTYSSNPAHGIYEALEMGFNTISMPSNAFMTWIEAGDIIMPGAFAYIKDIAIQFKPEEISWLSGAVAVMKEDYQILKEEIIIPNDVIKEGLCEGKHWHSIQEAGTFFQNWLWKKAIKENAFKGLVYAGAWNLWRVFSQYAELKFAQWPLGMFRIRESLNTNNKGYYEEIELVISTKLRDKALREIIKNKNLKVSQVKLQDFSTGKLVILENDANQEASFFYHKCFGHSFGELKAIKNYQSKFSPIVSIITPFFDSRKFLKDTIESVLAQTYTNWELLLVDDGSTDGSEKIAMNYAKQYPDKIRYLCHEGCLNRGASPSRNLGFNNSIGEIILYLDSDDVLLPSKLETHITIFKEYPGVDVLFGETLYWYSWTGKSEDKLKDYIWKPWYSHGIESNTIVPPPSLLKLLILHYVMPCPCSLLMRRDIVDRIGGWPEDIQNCFDDQGFYVKLFYNASVFIASGCQEKYRQHEGSWCSVDEKEGTFLASRVTYLAWASNYLAEKSFHDIHIDHYLNEALKPYQDPANQNQIEIPLPIGLKNSGDLHRLQPISKLWGFDRGKSLHERGQPVDRFYIENFLECHSEDIKGHVLEIGDSGYTLKYGGEWVNSANVLDADPSNQQANYIYDLAVGGDGFPQGVFDCFILTQTLLLIYDIKSAIKNAYKALKPGGVLLVTLPGISQICRPEMELWGDYWRFTDASVRHLFGEVFGEENVTVETYGNVLSATAFLYGLSSQEIKREELEYNDPNYQVTIALRAVKPDKEQEDGIETEKEELARLQAELGEIYNSRAWKAISSYRRGRGQFGQLGLKGKQEMQRLAKTSLRFFKKVWKRLKLRSEAKLIRSSDLFDEAYYISDNPDVARAEVNPAYHYLRFGGFEGRNPSPAFCSTWYLDNNPDVKEAGTNPLIHYLKYGKDEGRSLVNDYKHENHGG